MLLFDLTPHPLHAPAVVRRVTAQVLDDLGDGGASARGTVRLRWRVWGATALVVPPRIAHAVRADGLWRATCFEAFLRPLAADGEGGEYVEFNFAPSGAWNAYDFTAYREGMTPRVMAASSPAPAVTTRVVREGESADEDVVVEARVSRASMPPWPCALALTAVLEEQGGIKSYWALGHPPGGAPDFHHATGFVARLREPWSASSSSSSP